MNNCKYILSQLKNSEATERTKWRLKNHLAPRGQHSPPLPEAALQAAVTERPSSLSLPLYGSGKFSVEGEKKKVYSVEQVTTLKSSASEIGKCAFLK